MWFMIKFCLLLYYEPYEPPSTDHPPSLRYGTAGGKGVKYYAPTVYCLHVGIYTFSFLPIRLGLIELERRT